MPGLYFEQFEVGQHFQHAVHRTVTETDNVLFSTLTMNPAALHLDASVYHLRCAPDSLQHFVLLIRHIDQAVNLGESME